MAGASYSVTYRSEVPAHCPQMFFNNRFHQLPTATHTCRHTSAHTFPRYYIRQVSLLCQFTDSYTLFFPLQVLQIYMVGIMTHSTHCILRIAHPPDCKEGTQHRRLPSESLLFPLSSDSQNQTVLFWVLYTLFTRLSTKHLLFTCTLKSTGRHFNKFKGSYSLSFEGTNSSTIV